MSTARGIANIGSTGIGMCRLSKVSTNLVLSPYNGNLLTIAGQHQVIPAAGVSLAATSLSPNTDYYIYAYMSGATMTLEASTTGHTTDASYGISVKSTDATRTLVGMARPITGPAWVDSSAQRFVISWFNRRKIKVDNPLTTNKSTTSTSYVEIDNTRRAEFLTWADNAFQVSVCGTQMGPTDNATVSTTVGVYVTSSVVQSDKYSLVTDIPTIDTTPTWGPIGFTDFWSIPTDGYSYATIYGKSSSGTATWKGSTNPASGDRSGVMVLLEG